MLATAESCTGGLVAGAITDIAGQLGLVRAGLCHAIRTDAKIEQLGVDPEIIARHGAVSEADRSGDGAGRASGASGAQWTRWR